MREVLAGNETNGIASRWTRRLDLSVAAALFVLALLPRVLGLASFLTVDEPAWIMRSARFTQALMDGNLAGTLQTNHPGITTAWTGSLGLAAYYFVVHPGAGGGSFSDFLTMAGDPYLTADLLPVVRLPTAILAACCVGIAYLLLRRTFGWRVSLLAAILIALDPFFVALARVLHHDALASMFVLVAVLSLVTYFVTERRPPYAGIAGAATGLAWLSKASTLFLGPLVVVMFVTVYLLGLTSMRCGWRRLRPTEFLRGLLLWGAAAVLTFLILWPAMWVTPSSVLQTLFGASADLAGSGHLQFFRGQVLTDPGPLFYPVVLFFRTNPITLIGLGASALFLVVSPRLNGRGHGETRLSEQQGSLRMYWLSMVCFVAFVTLSPKKQDRYLLPIFPFIDICAAVGLLAAVRWLAGLAGESGEKVYRHLSAGAIGLCLGFLLVSAAMYHPYYISYYNPLAGGAAAAQNEILVGWGEGMDLVGDYLNAKVDSQGLTAAAVPFRTLIPYFDGEVTNYLTSNAPALAADYVVTYITQVQRRGPNLKLWEHFQDQLPEATFYLHGIPYARLYPGPRYLSTEPPGSLDVQVDGNFGDKIELLGCDYELRQGEVAFSLFWQPLRPLAEDYNMSVRLLDGEGHRWAQDEGEWVGGLLPTSHSSPEYVVRDERALRLPAGMPAGDYDIEVHVYATGSGENLAVQDPADPLPRFGLEAGTASIPKQQASVESVTPQFAVGEEVVEGIQLLGYDLPETRVQPGETLSPVFYWWASTPITTPYDVSMQLETGEESVVAATDRPIAGGTYPTTLWQPEDVVRDWQTLQVPSDAPPGTYQASVTLASSGKIAPGARLVRLGEVQVEGRSRHFDVPPDIRNPSHIDFADRIRFLGYDLAAAELQAAQPLRLTLYWQALSPMNDDYKLFVHVVDAGGQIWGQKDMVPSGGEAPTTGWVEDEVITDQVDIDLGPDAPTGRYRIRIGWYDEVTGRRLPVVGEAPGEEDSVILADEIVLSTSEAT